MLLHIFQNRKLRYPYPERRSKETFYRRNKFKMKNSEFIEKCKQHP